LIVPLVVVPLGAEGDTWRFDAWSGGVYHILSHAFAKGVLFLCAGTVLHAMGNDRLEAMRGMSMTMPITAFAFGIAGISLIGLPPSGSFIAKWLMLTSALGTAQWWWAAIIAIGTLLSGAYVFRLMRQAFAPTEAGHAHHAPRSMELTALGLALVALTLGLRAAEPLALLELGAPAALGLGGG
jgi:multicomponent Na+:H+ antiporter subunit D